MKNLFFSLGIALAATTFASAQDISKNALGLRIGGGDGFGTEISYQRALSGNNRLEIDLGIDNGDNYDGFKATGIYQWVWNIEDRFNWYAGAGGGLGSLNIKNAGSETFIFLSGQVGIEYNFDFPLLISLDTRPSFYLGDFRDGGGYDIALGLRYQF
jgi:hypothetical protein